MRKVVPRVRSVCTCHSGGGGWFEAVTQRGGFRRFPQIVVSFELGSRSMPFLSDKGTQTDSLLYVPAPIHRILGCGWFAWVRLSIDREQGLRPFQSTASAQSLSHARLERVTKHLELVAFSTPPPETPGLGPPLAPDWRLLETP
jgi:hypothetical protein